MIIAEERDIFRSQISVERKFAEECVAIFPLRPPKERHKIFIVPQVIFANFYNISYNIGIDKRNAPISIGAFYTVYP